MAGRRSSKDHQGRVVRIKGRRVVVRAEGGEEVTCMLTGLRAVVGDEVLWLEAPGLGGKLTEVLPRRNALTRSEANGREEVLVSNLAGLLIVMSVQSPPYRPGLLDRYLVGAAADELDAAIVVTKLDLGVDPEVEADLAWRESLGIPVIRLTVPTGEGLEHLQRFLADRAGQGPWVFVGHSGVGKTSLVSALLPGEDVGPIGEISAFWDQGRHTTTGARLFTLAPGVEIADSPGIRSFLPGGLVPELVRDHFPGIGRIGCKYRDCLHREGEEGCAAPDRVDPEVIVRYRRLLSEVVDIDARRRP